MGSRSNEYDLCVNVRGPHELAKTNEAGKELLSYLGLNEATVCNIWFEKTSIKAHGNTRSIRSITVLILPS